MSKKYNRYFLIFNEEDKGFGISSDKEPTGYTKVETRNGKCKITVYAQNLKTDKGPYVCYLVDSSKNPAIVAKLGELPVDEGGKGETVWEQDQKNIFGTGLSSDKFNIAAVVKEGSRLSVPLAGYSGKDKVQWRDKINSRSFVGQKRNDKKGIKEIEESNEESGDNDILREEIKDIIDSTDPSIKDQISEILVRAEIEVLEENNEIVEEIIQESKTSSDQDSKIVEESSTISEDTRLLQDNLVEDGIDLQDQYNTIEDIDIDAQLQRDDREYVDLYTEEGMKFKHYEEDINLQNADIHYADIMTRDIESFEDIEHTEDFNIPYVNKMHIFEADDSYNRDSDNELILEDARDLVTQSIQCRSSILSIAMRNANIDREKLCNDTEIDFDKLDDQVEIEFRHFLDEQLRKYKQSIIDRACNKEHHHDHHNDHGHHGHHGHHDHHKHDEDDCGHHDHHEHDKKHCGHHDHHEHDDDKKHCGHHDHHEHDHDKKDCGHHMHHEHDHDKKGCGHHMHHEHDHDKCGCNPYMHQEHNKDCYSHNYNKHMEHDCGCHSDKHHEHGKHNKKKGYAKDLHNILRNFEEVKVKGAKDSKFWKVMDHEKFPSKGASMYPYYSAIFHLKMTYPYINYIKYFKAKKYYYFGIKYDKSGEVKYLIYGIEGDKKETHQPYKGMTGFVSWTPHRDTGIWLMYYNPYTGCVMLPKVKDDKKKK